MKVVPVKTILCKVEDGMDSSLLHLCVMCVFVVCLCTTANGFHVMNLSYAIKKKKSVQTSSILLGAFFFVELYLQL